MAKSKPKLKRRAAGMVHWGKSISTQSRCATIVLQIWDLSLLSQMRFSLHLVKKLMQRCLNSTEILWNFLSQFETHLREAASRAASLCDKYLSRLPGAIL